MAGGLGGWGWVGVCNWDWIHWIRGGAPLGAEGVPGGGRLFTGILAPSQNPPLLRIPPQKKGF